MTGSPVSLLFVLTLINWEVSCAHFNNAISFATLVFNRKEGFKENLGPFFILSIVQFIGLLLGIFFTFVSVNHEYQGATDRKAYRPATPTLCPAWGCPDVPVGHNEVETYKWNAFFVEFVSAFCFVFAWLIIRNHDLDPSGEMSKWQNLLKPFFVGLAYTAIYGLDWASAAGLMNPTLTIEIWFWGMGSYNDKNPANNHQTIYFRDHQGRYIWLYILADYLAAICAGLLARVHFNYLEDDSSGASSSSKTPFVEN